VVAQAPEPATGSTSEAPDGPARLP
jgi:hypothetical protein